ncbi:MAG TPA: CPBP family intramembrane glutamic endopeptidase [Methylomirabilota bacterium]|jgi:hypothetical protein|nr:CPBP family intramembrane glutamic endopeptidase [Methylomirabilota bacterium]
MEVQEALARAPRWERRLYELTMTQGASELKQAIAWYEELALHSLDPLLDVRLAILRGEAGQTMRLRETLAEWSARGEPFTAYVGLIGPAYLGMPLPHDEDPRQALERLFEPDWFRARLARRLATRIGDQAWLAETRAAEAARVAPLLTRVRGLAAIDVALVLIAGLAIGAVRAGRRRRGAATAVGDAPLPPPWPGRAGVVTLVRGGAGGALVALGLLGASRWAPDSAVLETASIPLMNLPLLVIARQRLVRPLGVGLARALGLLLRPGGLVPLVLTTAVLAGAGVLIDLALGALGERFGLAGHWTEWFDSDIAWGSRAMLAANLAGAVVLAPVFEEIAFRGLLYGTLRRRFGWAASAIASAIVFALAHGYGLGGFASVFLSGVLWAAAYERTGSLWPGIIAHAINNVSASLMVIWLIRA